MLLKASSIETILSDNEVNIIVLKSIDSTNHYFKTEDFKKLSAGKKIHCCFSEEQTQGRGRLNRSWHSPFGQNIYLSCYYPLKKSMSELSGLSLVVGLAIVSALKSLGLTHHIRVKWPNDVLCHQKKMAGILIDIMDKHDDFCSVILGIGLNVNMMPEDIDSSPDSITQSWTSLREEFGIEFDRNHVAAVLLQKVLTYVRDFDQEGLSVFLKEWSAVDFLKGQEVTLQYQNSVSMMGEAMGINSNGHLLLRLPDGNVQAFSSGEASLKKKK